MLTRPFAIAGFKDYSIAFYIALGCSVAAAILIYTLDVEVTKQKGSIFKTAKLVVKMVDVDVFLIVQVVVGTCWGLHMNFFSFYVDVDLKASKTLFGKNTSNCICNFYQCTIVPRCGAVHQRLLLCDNVLDCKANCSSVWRSKHHGIWIDLLRLPLPSLLFLKVISFILTLESTS